MATTSTNSGFVPTWQHVENAKQLMLALAVMEAQGNRDLAERMHAKHQAFYAEHPGNADYHPAMTLALFLKDQMRQRNATLSMLYGAALAIELGLEPDETARREAAELVAQARSR